MASLIVLDTSGVFAAGPEEIEVPELRTRSFRKFALPPAPDGRKRWRVGGGIGPVHYRSDGDPFGTALYDEIDLTLQPNILSGEDRWRMERCGYAVRLFPALNGLPYGAEYRRASATLQMAPLGLFWQDALGNLSLIRKPIGGLREEAIEGYKLWWPGAFGVGTAFGYDLSPDRFRKVVRIDKPTDMPKQPLGATHLVVGMALNWRDAAPTAFATKIALAPVADCDLSGLVTERLDNPAKFPMVRADGRQAFWMAEPIAWDSAEERRTWPLRWRLERRGAQVVGLYGLPAEALREATWPLYIDTDIPEEQVGASSDDWECQGYGYPGTTNIGGTATGLDMGSDALYYYNFGARFQTVPIPQGANIDNAYISLCDEWAGTATFDVGIWAENIDDSSTFGAANLPGVQVWANCTGTPVRWNVSAEARVKGQFYPSPDIATPVQEVTDQLGWALEQNMSFVIANIEATLNLGRYTPRSWDYAGNVSGPKFNGAYTEAAGGVIPPLFQENNLGVSLYNGLLRC